MDLGLSTSSRPSTEHPVYLGVWTNWSKGQLFGATLTLSRQDGDLLIAFVAFFVTFVGTRFWRICCVVFHLLYSSHSPQDGLYHQRQAIFRNASNAESGLVSFLQMAWAWKRSSRRTLLRMLAPFVVTLCCVLGFIIASGFSSRVSTGTGNEVLISSDFCGWLNSSIPMSQDLIEDVFRPGVYLESVAQSSYAKECYMANASSVLDCSTLIKKNLASRIVIDTHSPCPFTGGLCRSNDSNLMIDSGYLDSNDDFGLNAPPDKRFQFRHVAQCAPLSTENRTSTYNISSDRSYTRYHFGPFHVQEQWREYSYEYINDRVYEVTTETANGTSAVEDYSLGQVVVNAYQGSLNYSSNFEPIPELRRPDADLEIIFLSANGITFANKTEDAWYKATKPWKSYIEFFGPNPQRLPAYMQNEPASPLACIEQWQYCNPNLPEPDRCAPLSSFLDAGDKGLELFGYDEKIYNWFFWIYAIITSGAGGGISEVVDVLGAQALTSRDRLSGGYQRTIPGNQWQRDVAFWFATSLTSLQEGFVKTAAGPSDIRLRPWLQPPKNSQEEYWCKNQKIRSTSYSSFSLFGLGIIFGLGGLITVVSYALSPLLAFLQRRRKFRAYANVEWCVNETLQLQRLAHEGVGCGTWSKAADGIPTTRAHEELAFLDISDPDRPKLKPPQPAPQVVEEHHEFSDEKRVDSNISERSEAESGDIAVKEAKL